MRAILAVPATVLAAGIAFLAMTAMEMRRTVLSPEERHPEGDVGNPLPGAPPFNAELTERLEKAWASRPHGYTPNTRHLRPDGRPLYTNRLFLESSPYLRQHAHNPVNWYPWGDEAFETAKRLGRPVLLSVGYSTCHWCHVMEGESFEDEGIAAYMNGNYIAVKVDREERPDIDAVYMTAVQMIAGNGGWPMTVWLTPDRRPFLGGTYFPPRDGDRGAQTGFLTLLTKLKDIYDTQPERVADSASQIAQAIRESMTAPSGDRVPSAVLKEAEDIYVSRFDPAEGGLAGTPKFPSSLPVRFLLRRHRETHDEHLLRMAELTLEKMATGGIHDRIGGGFHRYSTDERWLVPHFEKMLYDNALLALAYLEGSQAAHREDFAEVARDILGYIVRDMTSPEGAFYSATDADSPDPEGRLEEGRFFTWTPKETTGVLGKEKARIAAAYFGVTDSGDIGGRSVLHIAQPLPDIAREFSLTPDKARAVIEEARERLFAARAARPAPRRDEKIVTAWNGLMISAFARAGLILGDAHYTERAERAADFLLTAQSRDGRLFRSTMEGRAGPDAYLDDYAFLIAGLLDLFEATSDPHWLAEAMALDSVLEKHYEDAQNGGFFLTSDDHEKLLVRQKPGQDGAEPSGNSIAAMSLLRLAEFTGKDSYRRRAERTFAAFAGTLTKYPSALSEMLLALDFSRSAVKEIVIVTTKGRDGVEPFLERLRRTYLPNRVLAVVREGTDLAALAKIVPLVEGKTARKGKTTAYVCENRTCKFPTTDPEIFAKQIR